MYLYYLTIYEYSVMAYHSVSAFQSKSMQSGYHIRGVWCSGLVRWCSDQGVTVSNPTAVSMSLCPWDTSPQIAPVGIAHSIEYVSRFG